MIKLKNSVFFQLQHPKIPILDYIKLNNLNKLRKLMIKNNGFQIKKIHFQSIVQFKLQPKVF